MAIARVGGQAAGALTDSGTSVSRAYPGNVTAGNLLVICVSSFKPSNDAFVLGDISKSAGTATLGSFQLDSSINATVSGGFLNSAVYSAPVTGTGSCTITVGGAPASSALILAVQEYSGADVSSSRLDGQNTGNGASGAPTTGNVTSTSAAVFVGIVGTQSSSSTTHTPDGAFSQIFEEQNGSLHMTGNAEDQIVVGSTLDAASWTAPTTVPWSCALAVYKAASVVVPYPTFPGNPPPKAGGWRRSGSVTGRQ